MTFILEGIVGFTSILAIVLAWKVYQVRSENTELKKTLIDVYKNGLMETDQAKEDFIKFISDSREWAFEYIENVQKELNKFVDAVDKDIKHFDEFGIVASASPHYETLKNISEAYNKLQILLPDEKDNR